MTMKATKSEMADSLILLNALCIGQRPRYEPKCAHLACHIQTRPGPARPALSVPPKINIITLG